MGRKSIDNKKSKKRYRKQDDDLNYHPEGQLDKFDFDLPEMDAG